MFCGILIIYSNQIMAENWLQLRPFSFSNQGFLGLSSSYTASEDINSESFGYIAESTLKGYGSGYVYRPWVTTIEISTEVDLGLNHFDIYQGEQQSYISTAVGSSLVLYPTGTMPTTFSVNFDQRRLFGTSDNVISNGRFTVNNRLKTDTDRIFTNRYDLQATTEQNNERLHLRHDYNLDYSASDEDSNKSGSFRFINQSTELNGNTDRENNILGNYNVNWRLGTRNNTGLATSLSSVERTSADNKTTTLNGRLSSNSTFYLTGDPKLRLLLIGQIIGYEQDILRVEDNGQIEDYRDDRNTLTGNINLDYEMTDSLQLTGGIFSEYNQQVNGASGTEENSVNLQEQLSLKYRDRIDIGPFNYNYFVGNTIVSEQKEEGGVEKWQLDLSHGLKRYFPLAGGSLQVSGGESIAHEQLSKGEKSEPRLNHDLAFNWGIAEGVNNAQLFARFSDERILTTMVQPQNLIDLGLDGSVYLTATQSWGGNLNFNYSSRYEPEGDRSEDSFALGHAWYKDRQFFDIYGLYFESLLTLPVSDLVFDDGDDRKRITTLENKLSYRLGLLEVNVDAILTEESRYYSLSIKRHFYQNF